MSHRPEQVEDSGSRIRVTAFQAFPVGGKAYVKIETNMGVTGWGEINNMETQVACHLAESLSEVIIGENPTRIEHHWQRLFRIPPYRFQFHQYQAERQIYQEYATLRSLFPDQFHHRVQLLWMLLLSLFPPLTLK